MELKYMRSGLEDRYGFLELQDKILEIMVDIDKFCERYKINYCLMGGSALGAKRHGGFIPWDDDLDIYMTSKNYARFRKAFERFGNKEKYYLQEFGRTDGMITTAKIRLNGTTYMEDVFKDWDIHQGIFVDIFILHSCPENIFQQLHQCFWAKYAITKGLALREKGRHTGFKGLVIKLAKLTPERSLIKYALKQVYKYRNKETKYYCDFLGRDFLKKGIHKREWFDDPVYAPFETVRLKVPRKLHEYLTKQFGNYMKPPSMDRIKYEQHAESWDLDHQTMITPYYNDEIHLI